MIGRECTQCGTPTGSPVTNPHGTMLTVRRGEVLCQPCFVARLTESPELHVQASSLGGGSS